jgi:hypothetical protein
MIDLLKGLWGFMRERKKFWLAPIIVVLLLLGALIVFPKAQPSRRSYTPCFDAGRNTPMILPWGCRAAGLTVHLRRSQVSFTQQKQVNFLGSFHRVHG